MFKKEKKEVKEIREITVAAICDECGREHKGSDYPDDWHYFNSHHNDWGNDSCNSYKYYLVCSPECYAKALKKAVTRVGGSNTAEVDDKELDFAKRLSDYLITYMYNGIVDIFEINADGLLSAIEAFSIDYHINLTSSLNSQ